jgi:pyruvate/2-oxoglutarate dehydrogenase complex dihydrolipoamide dehydrogenase (E3) component
MNAYDAIVIGTGQAGPSLANQLAKQGRKVAVAEAYRFGGSCVNYGCRPTKTLIASARVAHLARRGAEFGVMLDGFAIDWARVRERVIKIIEDASRGTEQWLRGTDGIDVFHVRAVFEGQAGGRYRVRLGETLAEAPLVFINTGTRARVPAIEGVDSVPWLDSERLLRQEVLPEHLIILGGSYIGLEMGQAFRRLGSRVTIIETSECMIAREDDDIKHEVHRIFAREGIEVLTSSNITRARPVADGIEVTVQHDDGSTRLVTGSHWLNAIGRVPNSDTLEPGAVGIELDRRGFIMVDDHLQTTAPGVYALGDVNGKGAFTHTAYQDYEIVRDNLLHGRQRSWRDRTITYALFTDPPLGRFGLSEGEARRSGRRVLKAIKPMSQIGRAVEQAETDGVFKILVDADSEQIIGASVLGLHADEVTQAISYFAATGASYKVMMETLPIHPTVAEFLPTLLSELSPLAT